MLFATKPLPLGEVAGVSLTERVYSRWRVREGTEALPYDEILRLIVGNGFIHSAKQRYGKDKSLPYKRSIVIIKAKEPPSDEGGGCDLSQTEGEINK